MPVNDPIRVLVVDDRFDKLLAIEAVLEPLRVETVRATSGQQAVELARGTEFAVILMDVRMPGMNGFEAATLLRKQQRNSATPIIFVSAVNDEELVRKGYALGAVDYIRELVPEILRTKVSVFVELYRKSTDLAERRRLERQFQAQYTATRLLSQAEKPADGFPQVLEVLGNGFGWEWSAWWRVMENNLECTATWHDPKCSAEALSALSIRTICQTGEGLPGRVLAATEPIWISEIGNHPDFPRQHIVAREGWRSAVGFPVFVENEVVGVIECFTRIKRVPDQEALNAFRAIGDHLGQTFARKRVEARRLAMLEASLDAIITVDKTDRIIEWNPAAEHTFGYTRDEALGRSMTDLIVPEGLRDAHRKALQYLLETGYGPILGKRIEMQALRADGSEFPAEVAITQIKTDGPPLFTGYLRDITQRKQAEEQLQRAKHEAETANQTKDHFLAALSHELRTPLTPVVALLPILLEDSEIPERVRNDLSMIKRNVELETRLIDDLLDLTRITKGKLHLNLQQADVRPIIEHSLQIVRKEISEKHLTVHQELHAESTAILADPTRLQQVLWNLLKNAIKFTPDGGEIWITSSNPEEGEIQIEVRDSGIGVTPDRLSDIFDPFEQNSTAIIGHQFGGLGLGLFISKGIIEQHGGTIEAESHGIGTGATFRIRMAVCHSRKQVPEKPASGDVLTKRSLCILLIEDHADTRDTLQRLLTRKGHTVRTAQTVQEALQAAGSERFDLIVSDIGLPDGSGLELMPQLKSRYGLKGIALSGYGMEADLAKSRKAGFSAHLTKPVDFKQLEAALQQVALGSQL